jgi:predicted RNA-binding Zn-ribbon protein involved in translation (DUF1610 family)
MTDAPFIAIGNDELNAEPIRAGDIFTCPDCGEDHEIRTSTGTDRHGRPTTFTLQFYKCGETTLLAGIRERSLLKRRTDA